MSGINDEELKKHVKDKDTWLRFVYLVAFAFIFYFLAILTFGISVFQFLSKLFSGSVFEGLVDIGDNVATYLSQVTRFMTFASDEKPFPFAPLPSKKSS